MGNIRGVVRRVIAKILRGKGEIDTSKSNERRFREIHR